MIDEKDPTAADGQIGPGGRAASRGEAKAMSHRVLAIVTDGLHAREGAEEIRRHGGEVELRVVVPAIEASGFRHALGDVDEPRREAAARLEETLAALRRDGIRAEGEIGDPDPVQAAQDALLKGPADEILIFEHEAAQPRWFENGLFERAQAGLEPPLRLVVLHDGAQGRSVAEVEEAGRGTFDPGAEKEIGSAYLPGLSRADFAGMVVGVVGTIVAIVLAAAAGASGPDVGWKAIAIGIAIAIALINMAHVVGLTLFETVHYRGGFAKFFRTLSLIGTPAAVLANLLILLFA